MRKAMRVCVVVTLLVAFLGVYHGWPRYRKQVNEPDGFTYVVWPWPSGEANDPHRHEPPLSIQPALTPATVRQLAEQREAVEEYPAWFVESESPDGQYELRLFVDNANDYWYVKNLKTGRMLEFRAGTHPENPVWQGDHLIVDSQDFWVSGAARLHVVVDLDRLAVEEALLLRW